MVQHGLEFLLRSQTYEGNLAGDAQIYARMYCHGMAAFALASLSVVGIPVTSGFVSKWYLAIGAVEHQSLILLGVLLVSSLLNAIYLGSIVYKAYFEKESSANEEIREVGWIIAPLTISAALSLLLGIFSGPVLALAGRVL